MLKWRSRTKKSEIRDEVSGFFFLALKLELLPWEPLMLQNTIMTSLNNILTQYTLCAALTNHLQYYAVQAVHGSDESDESDGSDGSDEDWAA